ncbi:hypothetical protein [Leisingera sp.]|uniref:hypothetical protein n=1 Tax=Leisingera sp. TaxID=1879318 RepID=UPI002B2745D6|nr:hypothetical protein [Leisingera sp.]
MFDTAADREEAIFGMISSQLISAYQGVEALEQQAKALLRTISTTSSMAGVLPGNREQEDRCLKVKAILAELTEACSEARNSFGQI